MTVLLSHFCPISLSSFSLICYSRQLFSIITQWVCISPESTFDSLRFASFDAGDNLVGTSLLSSSLLLTNSSLPWCIRTLRSASTRLRDQFTQNAISPATTDNARVPSNNEAFPHLTGSFGSTIQARSTVHALPTKLNSMIQQMRDYIDVFYNDM
ncbi:unnamed protein product [Protopolystoma xenopodis]|uniref:Uncharacterized protein n=1 Tax=Protopolystoma xenopodis TaxID=117903 RepID=A0A3S4ZII5_9PLAT|nr:unnamed protein product [Protopolystoma xenopodis]